MAESSVPPVHREGTVMWRMQRGEAWVSHAVIAQRDSGTFVLMWFVNDRPLGYREFTDWTTAIDASQRMQRQNWAVGWRLVPEYDDTPAAG
jgi:hypothetical protein